MPWNPPDPDKFLVSDEELKKMKEPGTGGVLAVFACILGQILLIYLLS